MIEITKQEALVLAIIALHTGQESENLSEEVLSLVENDFHNINTALDKLGVLSIEDTNQLIKKLILKGIEND